MWTSERTPFYGEQNVKDTITLSRRDKMVVGLCALHKRSQFESRVLRTSLPSGVAWEESLEEIVSLESERSCEGICEGVTKVSQGEDLSSSSFSFCPHSALGSLPSPRKVKKDAVLYHHQEGEKGRGEELIFSILPRALATDGHLTRSETLRIEGLKEGRNVKKTRKQPSYLKKMDEIIFVGIWCCGAMQTEIRLCGADSFDTTRFKPNGAVVLVLGNQNDFSEMGHHCGAINAIVMKCTVKWRLGTTMTIFGCSGGLNDGIAVSVENVSSKWGCLGREFGRDFSTWFSAVTKRVKKDVERFSAVTGEGEKGCGSLSSPGEPLFLPTFRQRQPLPPAENRCSFQPFGKGNLFLRQRTALPSNLQAKAETHSFSNLSAKAENLCPFSPLPGEGREPDTVLTYSLESLQRRRAET
ncbi:hypothetical protein M5K25_026456 [Dendrobium thyrsiflorum]|uniref:Uncharacterized protein n=1 Tax=Dendrobium thyrsiflorum TaxID=117978 RepID=A0ABD0TXM3_DENTH